MVTTLTPNLLLLPYTHIRCDEDVIRRLVLVRKRRGVDFAPVLERLAAKHIRVF